MVIINVRDKPYHLYHASILFCPVSCFTVGWVAVVLLLLHTEISTSLVLLLVCLFVFGFLGNAIVYFLIDAYEEHTFVLMGRGTINILIWFAVVSQDLNENYKKHQEQQRATAQRALVAKVAFSKKIAMSQELSSKTSLTSSKDLKNSSLRHAKTAQKTNNKVQPVMALRNKDTSRGLRHEGQRKREKCFSCRGKGRFPCPECGGTGYKRTRNPKDNREGIYFLKKACPKCYGGKTVSCDDCNGLGKRHYIELPW